MRAFDGGPGELTEMDALVAYLQILGRLTDAAQQADRPLGEVSMDLDHDTLVGFAKTCGLFYLIALSIGRADLRLSGRRTSSSFDRAAKHPR